MKQPKHERLLDAAAERIHAAVRELKELGIIDDKGIAFEKTSPRT
jgi:hypothetical protein